MSDKARYGIALALGFSIGAVYLVSILATGSMGGPWVAPIGFAVTFGTTMAACNILRD